MTYTPNVRQGTSCPHKAAFCIIFLKFKGTGLIGGYNLSKIAKIIKLGHVDLLNEPWQKIEIYIVCQTNNSQLYHVIIKMDLHSKIQKELI